MKADFSRGFNPDRKRGMEYRRVLLQQGRVLLDSDVAALVDANDQLLRRQDQDLGTDAGGRNLAFLITAGHLYATFRNLSNVHDPSGGPALTRRIDYAVRFRSRFPSLRVDGIEGMSASVAIELFSAHVRPGKIVLWLRRDDDAGRPSTAPTDNDGPFITDLAGNQYQGSLNGLSATEFRRFAFSPPPNTAGSDASILIHLAALRRVWIGLIESDHVGTTPFFIQPGTFHIQGLSVDIKRLVESPHDTAYEVQVVPAPAPLSIGGNESAIAYVEGWERLITALNDPGIRERALSTGLDTSVRTKAVGQVKVLTVQHDQQGQGQPVTPEAIHAAFANQYQPSGTVGLTAVSTAAPSDPCDVLPEHGSTGRENRLYHIEVHSIQGSTVTFKISRESGSELFAVEKYPPPGGNTVFLQSGSGLHDGDLVEVLTDIIELGDGQAAQFVHDSNNRLQFVRPRRLVGILANIRAVTSTEVGLDQFRLVDIHDPNAPIVLPVELYPVDPPSPQAPLRALRLRRWSMFEEVVPSPTADIPIENGLQFRPNGTFEVGDWWQFESRLTPNAGDISLTRHGPERLFAPLAILENDPSGDAPRPEVSQWLDEPFVPLSEISADTIHFDDTASRQVGFTDLTTLQAVLDQLLIKGPGKRIVDRITHSYNNDTILVGSWQMTVGDGATISDGTISFGDFNGTDAIQQAVTFIRSLVGMTGSVQNPWSLSIFVKRGRYEIGDGSNIVLGPGECLRLCGEDSPLTSGTGSAPPVTTIQCTNVNNPAFHAAGAGSRISLENLATIGMSTTALSPIVQRDAGEIRITRCHMVSGGIVLSAAADSSPPQFSLVLRDSTLEASQALPMLNVHALLVVQFPAAGNVTCPRALIEQCRISVPVDTGFATVGTANAAVRLDGLTLRNSTVKLGGSAAAISANFNPGLFAVQVATLGGVAAPPDVLSIGDILFENCTVDAGSPASATSVNVPGLFLHLPAGNDNSPDHTARVSRIDSVVIRGGRWTVRSDTVVNSAIYVGDRLFDAGSTDTRISTLVIESVDMGWSTSSTTFRYVTTLASEHAFAFMANRVTVRNVSIFGAIDRSVKGDVTCLGIQNTIVDGLRIENVRASSAGTSVAFPPVRLTLFSAGTGLDVSNLRYVSSGTVAATSLGTGGVVYVTPAGTANTARRTQFRNCHVKGNTGGGGFFKGASSTNELDVAFIDCSATECGTGLLASQSTVGLNPSYLTVRGGQYSGNVVAGISISVASYLANVSVEGATCTKNTGPGLQILPSFTGEWLGHGPVVVNNRVFSNTNAIQILIGSLTADQVGGVCMGNYCMGTEIGNIMVMTEQRYMMRGLSTAGVVPWAERTILEAVSENGQLMAFNQAIWVQS